MYDPVYNYQGIDPVEANHGRVTADQKTDRLAISEEQRAARNGGGLHNEVRAMGKPRVSRAV